MKLKDKVAIVTGAARGIGRAHALRLARLGADVVISDIDLKSHQEFDEEIPAGSVVEEVKALGAEAIGIQADVGKEDQVKAMVSQTLSEFGRIDILINNAGGLAGDIAKSYAPSVSIEDLTATMDRNLTGTIFCCQAVAETMKEQKWGRIVTTSSQAGPQAQDNGV